ncbi:hypothetical protein HCEG_00767 [Histoplasma capsulatum var. duboisii H88]|uniref:Uncharacterized protein n=1 Tax=Ajellomyces capsulatus (strain H88) TaxID=544711 RepID=F0U614_AJEC8|nr:hypothetical protein HCEG_00767 [Histoplasma capsulatum var. duboisii H88]
MSVNRPAKLKRTSHPDQALKKNMQGRSLGLIRARGDISLMASEPWRGFDQQWYHLAVSRYVPRPPLFSDIQNPAMPDIRETSYSG